LMGYTLFFSVVFRGVLGAAVRHVVPAELMVTRGFDVLTGGNFTDSVEVFSLEAFPAYMGVAEDGTSVNDDVFAKMVWQVSRASGSLQLAALAPLAVVYTKQHSNTVGETWGRHLDAFAAFSAEIKRHCWLPPIFMNYEFSHHLRLAALMFESSQRRVHRHMAGKFAPKNEK